MNSRPERQSPLIRFILLIILAGAVIAGMVLLFQLSEQGSSAQTGNNAASKTKAAEEESDDDSDDSGLYPPIKSKVDFNKNGVNDYKDFLIGARKYIETNPRYDEYGYYAGGYPPDDVGVCTDVIWKAFKNAGYSLKDMVDEDIKNHPSDYAEISKPDPNIDFRRVVNLKVFLDKYATKLTTDPAIVTEWQGGDIVTFYPGHIAIISDKRNANGVTFLLQNGSVAQEADAIYNAEISGHYRFDASKIDRKLLIKYKTPNTS